ncbi:MAG TPA: cation diffusion facilitator family transporter, partial [Chloroflexota bacterium]|nr:cation diffusion facilitator family transporter [Chloroflexota bacterium]
MAAGDPATEHGHPHPHVRSASTTHTHEHASSAPEGAHGTDGEHPPAPTGAPRHDHTGSGAHGHEHGPAGGSSAHGDNHAHEHGSGLLGQLREAVPFLHGHSHGESQVDAALEGSERGLWALKVSLLGLGVTALVQLIVVLISGSVGLLADTIHNFGDALTAVPLGVAFVLGRRPPTRRYTYGYGKAEDIAGVLIIALILLSALIAAYETVRKLIHPQPLHYLGWVMAAALVGFLGNEAVAQFRIRVGAQIGSAALVADGQHARVDGFTSLAVLIGALGVWAGFPLADPIVGLLITVTILFIVKDTVVVIWRRLMDAIDPELVTGIESATAAVPGVEQVQRVRLRWLGHRMEAEVPITVK